MEAGAMVGMSPTFDIKSKAGSLGKAIGRLFAGESMFQQEYTLKADGEVLLAPKYLGAIHEKVLDYNEQYIVDTNQLVLWNSNMEYRVELSNGVLGSITGGEGLVCIFKGPGKILMQTRDRLNMVSKSK